MGKRQTIFGTVMLAVSFSLVLLGLVADQIEAAVTPTFETTATISASAAMSQEACSMASEFTGLVGIFAKNLRTGQVVTMNADQVFAAASTIKIPVSIVVYRHFYKEADVGQRQVYDDGVELMMTVSDNEYFADFLDEIEARIGADTIRQHLSQLGMSNTRIRDIQSRQTYGYSNVTTARDMGLIFELLYQGKMLSPEKTSLMTEALSHTIFRDELPRYMQERRVLHKIGELDDVLADVGIVEGATGPVLISVFTETPRESEYASDHIAALSACLYSRLSGEKTSWEGESAAVVSPVLALTR